MTFLQAIAQVEGFYVMGSRSQRNLNPGDIEAGRFATAHGAIGSDGRFAKFSSADAGFDAMRALFQAPTYKGLTVEQALNRYAPPAENETNRYIAAVCKVVGCEPTDVIDVLL